MIYIRTILFKILFSLATLFSPVILLPFCNSIMGIKVCQYTYSLFIRIALKLSLGASVEFRGLENVPKDKPVIIIGKHQATLETILIPGLFDRPSFIMKKELLKIPVMGTWMKKSGQIPIDRDGGMKTLKLINAKAKEILDDNRVVIIFPEGTRSPLGEGRPYSVGAYFLAKNFPDVTVLPMALSTGCVWKNKSFLNGTGKIVIEFLKPLEDANNYKSKEYLKMVQDIIEPKTRELEMENSSYAKYVKSLENK